MQLIDSGARVESNAKSATAIGGGSRQQGAALIISLVILVVIRGVKKSGSRN